MASLGLAEMRLGTRLHARMPSIGRDPSLELTLRDGLHLGCGLRERGGGGEGSRVRERDADRHGRDRPPAAQAPTVGRLVSTGRDVSRVVELPRSDAEPRDDVLRERLGVIGRTEHDEVVAADVAEERIVTGSRDGAEDRLGQLRDQGVAAGESVAVVEALEVVDVEVEARELLACAQARGDLLIDGGVPGKTLERVEPTEGARPPERRLHARRELLEVERLRDVVVGTGTEMPHLVDAPR